MSMAEIYLLSNERTEAANAARRSGQVCGWLSEKDLDEMGEELKAIREAEAGARGA